jgi:2',3'-cyclic-nucleotide 2'-phosphodiesterase (5'-nucleotidase family)
MFGIDVACYGNHDFDFGVDELQSLASQTNFPWLLSNVFEAEGDTLAGAKRWHILEKNGLRIGFMGLVEKEWIETIAKHARTVCA